MTPSLIHEPIRKLPLWQDGYTHGRDVGLRIALDALVAEQTRQGAAAVEASLDPRQTDARSHAYAAGRLSAVAAIVGARFRQATS